MPACQGCSLPGLPPPLLAGMGSQLAGMRLNAHWTLYVAVPL